MPPSAEESATRVAVLTGRAAEPVPVAPVEQEVFEATWATAGGDEGALV